MKVDLKLATSKEKEKKPKTDAQRRAQLKYDKNHMKVLGCKMRSDRAEAFKAACESQGTTPNAVFMDAARNFTEMHGDGSVFQ